MLSAACASEPVTVVHEAPKVERMAVPAALLAPCARAKDRAPNPATATFLDAARYIVTLAARNDSCADQVEGLRVLLAP